jgi:predicted nuclease with TOPRIM domain
MAEKDKKSDERVEDLTAQMAALQIRLDNAESESTEAKVRADKAEGERDTLRDQVKELEKERNDDKESPARLKEQVKALAGKVARLEKERNDALSPEKVRAAVKDRLGIERPAEAVLGSRADFDDLDDRALMVKTIEHITSARMDESKSAEYVRARFDTLVEGYARNAEKLHEVRESMREASEKKAERVDEKDDREAFLEKQRTAWMTPDKKAS